MPNRYAIINRAADYIEQHPDTFCFAGTRIPKADQVGCALGHIGACAGLTQGHQLGIDLVAGGMFTSPEEPTLLGVSQQEFYYRMDELARTGQWRIQPAICAFTLRRYARLYHGPEKREPKITRRVVSALSRIQASLNIKRSLGA